MDDECDDDDGVEDEARLGDVVRPPNPPPHQPPPRASHPPHPPMTKPTKSKQIFVWPSTSLCIDRTALTYYRHADTRTRRCRCICILTGYLGAPKNPLPSTLSVVLPRAKFKTVCFALSVFSSPRFFFLPMFFPK